MPLTADEAKLISAVLDGEFEKPAWSTFLDLLKHVTHAEFVTLIFRPPARPLGEALHLFSGPNVFDDVRAIYGRYNDSLEFLSDLEMEEGRIYGFEELYPPRKPTSMAFFHEVIVPSGINSCYMVRVMEPSGVSAWLTISRTSQGFSQGAGVIMDTITPALRGALHSYVALQRERFISAVAGAAMKRLHFGWMALDADANIIDHDREAARVFALSGILSRSPGGRLEIHARHLKQGILAAVHDLSEKKGNAQAFTLSEDPWLDMLVMSASSIGMAAGPRATVIAYLHGDSWQAADRCEELKQLFGLSRSEARLALTLSRGMTITQAAAHLGIRIETARKCSKIIYGKTGAGGLPDLVRIVMRSVLALAPGD